MAQNPVDASIGVATGGAAPVRVEQVTDSLGNVVNEQVVTVEGIVSATDPSVALHSGDTAALSVTKDGAIRVDDPVTARKLLGAIETMIDEVREFHETYKRVHGV